MNRICKVCGGNKPPDAFYAHSKGTCRECIKARERKRYHDNRPEIRARFNQWVKDNKERVHGYERKAMLKYYYGITPEQYDEMFNRYGGVCWICRKPEIQPHRKYLCVDHSHLTGVVRGVLCSACNSAIGKLKADEGTEVLERALEYIKENGNGSTHAKAV